MADASNTTDEPSSEPMSEPRTEPRSEPGGGEQAVKEPSRRRRARSAARVRAGAAAVRSRVASVVWLVAVVCALILAVGALLVALKANEHNSVVRFVLEAAGRIDGPFSRDNGIFTFSGVDAATKAALVNWGIAAVIYLVVGKILDRVIRP